jgi:hypothetical protein
MSDYLWALILVEVVTITFYALTLALALHNLHHYILKQERYLGQGIYLLLFYIFAIIILFMRLIEYCYESS